MLSVMIYTFPSNSVMEVTQHFSNISAHCCRIKDVPEISLKIEHKLLIILAICIVMYLQYTVADLGLGQGL